MNSSDYKLLELKNKDLKNENEFLKHKHTVDEQSAHELFANIMLGLLMILMFLGYPLMYWLTANPWSATGCYIVLIIICGTIGIFTCLYSQLHEKD